MKNILTVIGARPQIIKAAAFSRAVAQWNLEAARGNEAKDGEAKGGVNVAQAEPVREWILHTGQHYDANMSGVFFGELGIPEPDFNLGVGSGTHGAQTAKMIAGIEAVLTGQFATNGHAGNPETCSQWDGVVLYGDTNSTLAGAVAAAKLHIPVYHIEAGLRSFNMAMPEEINRIVCDQLSTILFAPTRTAEDNLAREGFNVGAGYEEWCGDKARFADGRVRRVVNCGDIMYDNALYYSQLASAQNTQAADETPFILATVHRQENTDDPARLGAIFDALRTLAKEGLRVVLPLHPRTAKILAQNGISTEGLEVTAPVGYLETLRLERQAVLVLTDSGGVQKEAFFMETPCVILRDETEWVEIVQNGAGILAGADRNTILGAARELMGRPVHFPPLFGAGDAAARILRTIMEEKKSNL